MAYSKSIGFLIDKFDLFFYILILLNKFSKYANLCLANVILYDKFNLHEEVKMIIKHAYKFRMYPSDVKKS